MTSEEAVELRRVVLKRFAVHYGVRKYISHEARCDIQSFDYGSVLGVAISSYLYGEEVDRKTHTFKWYEPKNDWQRLRRWLGWQFKSKVFEQTVDLSMVVTWPNMEYRPGWLGEPVITYMLGERVPWRA